MGVREIRSIADSSYSARSLSEFVVLVEMLAKNGQSAILGLGFISEKSSKIGHSRFQTRRPQDQQRVAKKVMADFKRATQESEQVNADP